MKRELKQLRKQNEKHFLNDDGTIEAVLYNDNVHYLKDGVYEEINNTLVEKNNRYHIVDNDFDLSFSKQNDENLLEFNKDGHYFKMSLRDSLKVYNKELKKDNKIRKRGSISYNNIFDNIDLNYRILPQKIKETIVFKDKTTIKNKIVFDIKTDLELTLENNKIVSEKFTILDSFMIDSNNQISKDIYYILNKTNYGYELILILDKGWLECSDRKYPVYVDPTIVTEDSNSLQDTYINSKYPNTNYSDDEILKTSVLSEDEICRTLIKFNLPIITTGCNVINAKLYVGEVLYDYLLGRYDDSIITIHKLTSDWNENTATWNNMNDKYDERVEDYKYTSGEVIVNSTYETGYVDFDITNLVKRWYAGTPNYGLMIKTYNEKLLDKPIFHDYWSRESNVDSTNPKPILVITYRNKNGLENYLTYQSQSLTNGIIYENNYNGNITANFHLGNTVGGSFPVSLDLFYNTNDVILNKNYGFGLGMQLNVHQIIQQSDLIEDDINLYEYIDEDGTIHYFIPKRENGEIVANQFEDEDNLSLSLFISNDSCELKDKYGNCKTFTKIDSVFYLTKIKNLKNNEINILYNSTKISSITDSSGKQITITYNDNSISINSPSNNSVLTITDGKLTKIDDNYGTTVISYNDKNIINFITDINGKKIGFEYYDVIPYRVKKVVEYGINNNVGQTLTFNYGFEVTQITNNKGISNTYTFNEIGNTVSISSLGIGQNINDCYGKEMNYGTSGQNINKLLSKSEQVKTVNNLIWNSGFEKDYNIFSGDDNLIVSITNEFCLDGDRSLKLYGRGNAYASIPVTDAGSYTFSFYSKAYDEYMIWLKSGENMSNTLTVKPSVEFERYELTIDNIEALSNVEIFIYVGGLFIGNVYLDNIQLEKGKVANYYNLIDNNNFSFNLAGWVYDNPSSNNTESTPNDTITFKNIGNRSDSIITYEDGSKALKVVCDPDELRFINRYIDIKGFEGDMLQFSFWYKNSGLSKTFIYPEGRHNTVQFILWPTNEEDAGDMFYYADLNSNSDEWQYYSATFMAPYDFNKFRMTIMSNHSANELYVTNFNLFKVDGLISNSYDENGNIIATYDKNSNENTFKYDKNNELIKMTNPIGNSLSYEYDSEITDKILSGISPTGITNSIKYDDNNNPIFTRIENKTKLNLENGNYYIRLKGTNKYLKIDSLNKKLVLKEDYCSHAKWLVTVNNNILTIKPLIQKVCYIDYFDLSDLIFTFEKQDNGSFILKNNDKYLTIEDDNTITLSNNVDLNNQQFYFEVIDSLFIESSAEYTSDGRFLTKTIDSLFNTINYNVNMDNGLINSVTNSSGATTNYTYNSKKQVTNISKGDMSVSYEYNNNNLLSKIILGNKSYNFNYDDYLRNKSVYINNNKLVENTYEENNGNLLNTTYGNDDIVSYEYDQFNRISKLIKMDNTYQYYYDHFGNLKQIDSNGNHYKYYYDLAQRLIDIIENEDFKIHYDYNELNNLSSKVVTLENIDNQYIYEYNNEGNIIKITTDGIVINYVYDNLQRLIQVNTNGNIVNYQYITNGKRTSVLVDSIIDENDNYKFKYDKLGNITNIYKNNTLIKTYYYDVYNQLIKEENPTGSIEYVYDNFGNILSRKHYNESNSLINTDTYEYSNNEFKDQLTKYNDISITYDNIGNPLTIGNSTLTWTNGRQLSSYSNDDLTVTYKYNYNGIRTEKTVNNVTYKYYLEDRNIEYLQTSNNMLYFFRDDNDRLIGFKNNSDMYYYIKNGQEDIIGIKNANSDIIATYTYDNFGKILSIKDALGNEITSDDNIAIINPFRYRSYYYDNETKLYYLNTRYYNPEWGRFLNMDGIIGSNKDILSFNLYSYCSNNFVNCLDSNGKVLNLIAKLMWKTVISALPLFSMKTSAEFLNDSIEGKAEYVIYGSSSRVANQIKEDSAFKKYIDEFIPENYTGYIEKSKVVTFENDDLQGSIMDGTVTVKGNVVNGCGPLDVTVYDVYDFKYSLDYFNGGFKNFAFTVGNNLAAFDQNFGTINNYEVYIFFEYDPCA